MCIICYIILAFQSPLSQDIFELLKEEIDQWPKHQNSPSSVTEEDGSPSGLQFVTRPFTYTF
jgi:hypothetical protein